MSDQKFPFGFVTGCHAGDRFIVGATLASMRYYCPDVPICLVVDGDVDVDELKEVYDLHVLRILDLPCAEMCELLSGSGRSKLAAMWAGPFERFLWVDSDAMILGDIRPMIRTDVDFQICWSEISVAADATEVPNWLPHYYFDLERLLLLDPSFEWRGHPYFSTGVFACKKNFVTYEEWLIVESWNQKSDGKLFKFWEQGMLNYLVLSRSQGGLHRVEMTDLQFAWRHHGKEELVEDCKGVGWRFPVSVARPKVVHFCGRKPFAFDLGAYSRPFTIARLEHHRKSTGEVGAWVSLLAEELGVIRKKIIRRIGRLLGSAL